MQGRGKSQLWVLAMFGVGFFYYLLTPFLAFLLIDDFHEYTPIEAALPYISEKFFDSKYFLDLFVIGISFSLGLLCFRMLDKWVGWVRVGQRLVAIESLIQLNERSIFLFILFFCFFFDCIYIFKYINGGGGFFGGYKTYDLNFLGGVSTILFVLAWFINFCSGAKRKIFLGVLLVINSVILLSLGARNILVACVLMLVFYGVLVNKIQITKGKVVGLSIFFVFLLFVGLWRTGYEYKLGTFVGLFLSEPLFVASSSAKFLQENGGRPVSGTFGDVGAFFISLIPGIFSLDKKVLLDAVLHDKFAMAPFGASSLLLNLYYNFGFFYPFYLFAAGLFYGGLGYLASRSRIFLVVYSSALSLLPFHFFNQHLFAFMKLILFNSLMLPLVLILMAVGVSHSCRSRPL